METPRFENKKSDPNNQTTTLINHIRPYLGFDQTQIPDYNLTNFGSKPVKIHT